jgi:hypothetical protein
LSRATSAPTPTTAVTATFAFAIQGLGQYERVPSWEEWIDIFSRSQGELQKYRKTGAEWHNFIAAMNDIYDTLAGSLVSTPSTILFQH